MTEPLNDPTLNPALGRKNMAFGWVLFAIFLALFAGTVVVAFIYLWIVD